MVSEQTQPTQIAGTGADREAIRDCIYRSALGNDLCDAELWKSTYWPDGTEDHGIFKGNAHEFVNIVGAAIKTSMDATWHHVSNTIIRFSGPERAIAHSYALVYCRLVQDGGGRSDLVAGVRYLDHLHKRGDDWRIHDRVTKTDWMRAFDGSLEWLPPDATQGRNWPFGMRSPEDPLHSIFSAVEFSALREKLPT